MHPIMITEQCWLHPCTVNLAVALATRLNLRVGLLDGDVHGPSIAQMMNLHGKPATSEGEELCLQLAADEQGAGAVTRPAHA
eukprot:1160709-Pelagomonas_calceolata.AAC.6